MHKELELVEEKPVRMLALQDWGLIEYDEALRRQLDLVDLVHQELARDTLVVCSHPAVVTVGRATQEGDIFAWQGPTVEVSRGGRATYHGPNQIVVYPILDMSQRGRDLHKYMRQLEEALIITLAEFGIQAQGRSLQARIPGEEIEATGVWVGSHKIASIGIGVRKWISFHGLALNVDEDPHAFQGLKPCGFSSDTMISMQALLGFAPEREAVKNMLLHHLQSALK